jgi:O-succinylbenzoate synthase
VTKVGKTFDRIEVVSLPLKSKFRGLQSRELMLVKGERWAEFSPFVEYPDSEAKAWLEAATEWANSDLPQVKRSRVPVNATLPAVGPSEVAGVLSGFPGFRTVKIKAAEKGQVLADDLARISEVARLFPQAKIRIDSNGAWSVPAAIEFSRKLQELNLEVEYLEQPVATIDELAELREKFHNLEIPFAIAADESIRKSEDPLEVIRKAAADILILKASPLGGIRKSLEIASASNLGVVVSSALESSIGLQAGLHLAATLDELTMDCGLGTAALFVEDVTQEPLLPENGYIEIRNIEPSEELIKKYSVSAERKKFWLDRLARVSALLES